VGKSIKSLLTSPPSFSKTHFVVFEEMDKEVAIELDKAT
jgi:hypothetical protein